MTSAAALSKGFVLALLLATALLVLTTALPAGAEIAQKGNVRVDFQGKLSPQALPREGVAPVAVSVAGAIGTVDGAQPPALSRLQIAINRHGRLDYGGLPTCPLDRIQPATNATALSACHGALVGEGSFAANVVIPESSPFPSQGKLLAFNGIQGGKPVIFAHVYGTEPVPTSFTLPLQISSSKGEFATMLTATLPEVGSNIAFVTSISLDLHRNFSYRGKRHSYLSAGCPAPQGFSGTTFPLLRASFSFIAAPTLTTTLNRSCRAKG
jgi:hypothetical protein